MTIEITKGKLQEASKSLQILGTAKGYEDKLALRIGKVLRVCQTELDKMQNEAIDLRNKIVAEMSSPPASKAEDIEKRVMTEVSAMADHVLQLDIKPLFASHLVGNMPTPAALMDLDWLIHDDLNDEKADTTH